MITSQKRAVIPTVLRYAICTVASLVVLVPLYVAIMGGFKSSGQLFTSPMGIPSPFVLSQYTDILLQRRGTFWLAMGNSMFITGFAVLFTVVFCSAAAFALARIRFRLNSFVYNVFLLGFLFPLAVAILPLYLQIRTFNLIDSHWGVILPQVAFQIPVQIILLRGFFKAIPRDLEDACSIDGYGPLGFLYHMVIPLSTPILATVAILTLVQSWNTFLLPLLVFSNTAKFPLPMGIFEFMGWYSTTWNLVLAYLTLAMVPAVILFIAAQKYIVAGLTGGAIKG